MDVSRGAQTAQLLLGGFDRLVELVSAELERQGHPGVTATHEFALQAIDAGARSASLAAASPLTVPALAVGALGGAFTAATLEQVTAGETRSVLLDASATTSRWRHPTPLPPRSSPSRRTSTARGSTARQRREAATTSATAVGGRPSSCARSWLSVSRSPRAMEASSAATNCAVAASRPSRCSAAAYSCSERSR